MAYKTFASINIAIIGEGNVADMYASGFAVSGHEVFIATKKDSLNPVNTALACLDNIHFCDIQEAADIADIVIIATKAQDVREVSYWLGDVRKKVILDASPNVQSEDNEPLKTIYAIKAITGSQHIVKVFNTEGYEQLLKPLFNSNRPVLILAGDSKKAKEMTKILATELNISQCVDFGGNDTIPLFNEMTRCWRNLFAMKEHEYKVV